MLWFRLKTVCFPAATVLGLGFCLFLYGSDGRAQTLEPGQKVDPQSLEWPRFYATNSYEFAVYQPCISKWPGNRIKDNPALLAGAPHIPRIAVFGGGLPITIDGAVVGGIGVSGGNFEFDERVAREAVEAIGASAK